MTVPGLIIIPNFISIDEGKWLTNEINAQPWNTNHAGTRRVQIYGPCHDSNCKIIPDEYSIHPEVLQDLVNILWKKLDHKN